MRASLAACRLFLAELRRRHVFRVAAVYAAVAFVVLQAADLVFPALEMPDWTFQFVVLLSLLGFPLALVLAWAFDLTPAGLRRTDPLPAAGGAPATASQPGATDGLAAAQPSVAVLPFVNMSGDAENEYFSDGVTEEILNALAKVEGLRVVARTSSFSFRGRDQDVREIARALGVGAVLEGSVRRADGQVRITAQLIDAADGCHLLSEVYDRRLEDLFRVQEEIARAIAHALRVRLVPRPAGGLLPGATADLEAHNLYLKGQHLWNQRTPQSLQAALRCFEQALERDPEYALAHAGRACAFALLGDYGVLPREDAFLAGKAAAARALDIEDALPEAHAALGFIRTLLWEWGDVEPHFRRALELEPDHAGVRHWYALYLAAVGRAEEALVQIERAQRLDPLSAAVHGAAAGLRYYARQPERALEEAGRALELDETGIFALALSGLAHEQQGRLADAKAALKRAASLAGAPQPFLVAALGHVHAAGGDAAEARRALDTLRALDGGGQPCAFCIGALHAVLREPEPAFDWLHRAIQRRDGWVLSLAVHPWLDPLRGDDRYSELLDAAGLRAPAAAQTA